METAAEELRFRGAGGDPIAALLVAPTDADEPVPGVVLVHEVFGLDAHVREVAERLAREGFAVIAPDLYSREGVPGPASTAEEPAPEWSAEEIRAAVQSLPDRRALADLEAAAVALGDRDRVDRRRIAVLGFCMGGRLAFLAGCTSQRVAATVVFYGRPRQPELSETKPFDPMELVLNLDRPLLAFYGGRDAGISMEDVEALRRRLADASKDFEIEVYPEAGHGFFNDRRPAYDRAAAEEAWERTLRFLRASL
jgi:carboxymethylenebutenolidase